MAELLLADLLDLLGHDGFTAVCHREQGGVFQSAVVLSEYAPAAVSDATGDVWFGVNPVQGPARVNAGRGTADDVVRLAAVYADLDVKPGGLPSMGLAGELIDVLSTMLNSRPSAMVLSGHGVQPYWPLSDGPSGPDARALLRRWGRLVAHVADMHGGQVDPVYDLSRVLRVPGTTNYKSAPVPVLGLSDVGHPLTVEELDERLVEYGAVELPGDRDAPGNIAVSPPANWQWAPQTCNYVIRMADGWAMDDPAARHPWLVAQATRIAAGHRYGCFDEAGYAGTVGLLVNRFRDLLVRGPESRKEVPGEIPDALAWGRGLAGAKTEAGVSAELGFHTHDPADADLTFNRGDGRPFEFSPENASPSEPSVARLRITWASDIEPKRVRWLWDARIAQGTLALLAGREGLGKSTLAYHMAAEVTRGLLPGESFGKPRVVLVCANEDSWEHTITPRLIAAGADRSKVARIDAEIRSDVHLSLSLPRDNAELRELAIKYDAGLLILDPLMSVVDGTIDTHRDREVRLALEPLVALAEASRMSIVGLIHHNKGSSADPLNMVMASKAFTAVARSVHTCIADPDDETEERRLFATTKNNLGQMNLPVLGFTIKSFPVETLDDGTAWTGKLHWTGEVEGKMRDIMSRVDQDRGAAVDAAEWLDDYLHQMGGAAAKVDIERSGKAAGHGWPAIKRAKERLHVTHRSEGFPRRTWWDLPGSSPSQLSQLTDEPTEPTGRASSQLTPLGRHPTELTELTVPHSEIHKVNGPVGSVGSVGADPTRVSRLCPICSGPAQNPDQLWCDPCMARARGNVS